MNIVSQSVDISSRNPSMSMIVIGLSSYAKTKVVLTDVWCLLTAGWMLYSIWSNSIEIPGMQFQYQTRKNKLYYLTLNNRTKALNPTKARNQTKKDRTNKSQTIKLAINNTCTDWLSVLWKCWIITIQYLQWLNIFVITELTIASLFCPCVSPWSIRCHAAEFYVFAAGSLVAFWKTTELPNMASCLTSRAVPVEFHNCNDSVLRVAGRL